MVTIADDRSDSVAQNQAVMVMIAQRVEEALRTARSEEALRDTKP